MWGARPSVVTAPSNLELERLLVDDPDDRQPFLVYGDWLAERDDPRAELIHLQLALELDTQAPEHLARKNALLEQYAVAWAGPIERCPAVQLDWKRGFVNAVFINQDVQGARDQARLLADLLSRPAGRLFRSLIVDGMGEGRFDDLPVVLATAKPPLLRELLVRLKWFEYDDGAYRPPLGRVEPLWALPRLDKLVLVGGNPDLGDIQAPSLVHFELRTPSDLGEAVLESLELAYWPKLETLSVARVDHGPLVQRVLDAVELPCLKHLAWPEAGFGDAICADLAQSRLLPQLETLAFSLEHLTTDGAQLLLQHQASFAHLSELRVDYRSSDADVRALLSGTRFDRRSL